MDEHIGFILQEPKTDRDQTIDSTIKETFKSLSVLADSLIEEVKKKYEKVCKENRHLEREIDRLKLM